MIEENPIEASLQAQRMSAAQKKTAAMSPADYAAFTGAMATGQANEIRTNAPEPPAEIPGPCWLPRHFLTVAYLHYVGMALWVKSPSNDYIEFDFQPLCGRMAVTCREFDDDKTVFNHCKFEVKVSTIQEFREFCRFLGITVPEPAK